MAGLCRNLRGGFEGYKSGLGYLFTFTKVLFEFLTFWRHVSIYIYKGFV